MNSKTMFYIVKRLILALVTVLVVVTVTFWAMQAIPGGPFNQEKAIDPSVIEQLNKLYGLDQPLFIQYLRYLGNALVWNFGVSLKVKNTLIMDLIGQNLPYSLATGLSAAALAIIIGIILGSTAALKHNKAADRTIMVLSTASVAMPSFVIATLFTWLFADTLGLIQIGGDSWVCYILPIVTISLSPMCYITRLTRSSTLDVLGADYIRTAQAKGVSRKRILFKHALRNSVTPVITYAGPMIAYIITGSIVVEQIFNLKGLGRMFVNSISARDYPQVMGTTVFLTFLMVIMVLVSDILYKIVNPRVDFD
ncbi:MAG: ABC transporter permease [Bacilli bacterium]|nr:ABC transporter permease [Bacilli bacterium]